MFPCQEKTQKNRKQNQKLSCKNITFATKTKILQNFHSNCCKTVQLNDLVVLVFLFLCWWDCAEVPIHNISNPISNVFYCNFFSKHIFTVLWAVLTSEFPNCEIDKGWSYLVLLKVKIRNGSPLSKRLYEKFSNNSCFSQRLCEFHWLWSIKYNALII